MCRCYSAPTSVPHMFILTVILVLQCIHNGAAIKCFVCDSSDNPSCADLSNKSIVAEECTLDKMKTTDTWLFDLNSIAYFSTGNRNGPVMNCQKVVARDPHTSKIVTARFCQLDTANSDACQILGHKLGWPEELARNANADKDNDNDSSNNNNNNKNLRRATKAASSSSKEDVGLHCSICITDSCNGTQSVSERLSWWASVLPALIAMMIRLRHSAW